MYSTYLVYFTTEVLSSQTGKPHSVWNFDGHVWKYLLFSRKSEPKCIYHISKCYM